MVGETVTKIVNLYGGPGCGKSTIAAQVFQELKWRNINCELVQEYAKERVWEGSLNILDYQIYIFAKQLFRIHRLLGKVDVVISDSPILLSLIYGSEESTEFKALVISEHRKMNTFDCVLMRTKPYHQAGRVQKEHEARDIDTRVIELLEQVNPTGYKSVFADRDAAIWIAEEITCPNCGMIGEHSTGEGGWSCEAG